MRAMICGIVQRAFIDGGGGGGVRRRENLCDSVDSTLIEPVLSAKAH